MIQVETIDIEETPMVNNKGMRSSLGSGGDEKIGMFRQSTTGNDEKIDKSRESNTRLSVLLRNNAGVRMQFDPTKAPEGANNPNMHKSQKVIDAHIGQDKMRVHQAKKKLEKSFIRHFNKWREYDLLTCLIAIVGLALAIVDWEYTRASA